ncbi:hypothetical protein [Adhaeribacter aerolatus]|uniref:hypothetical protein n=1 Tax=Adhaeribacter aerolatus TaxID=670289 RepID=UPI0011BF00A3|nr:hypothetical protein [Adhaeribacter aerolatus]
MLTVVLCVSPKYFPLRHFENQPEQVVNQPDSEKQNLVYQLATKVNASYFHILAEKELLVQLAVFALTILVFFPALQFFTYPSPFFSSRSRYLLRVLPNAP